jgi:hypothetical protein
MSENGASRRSEAVRHDETAVHGDEDGKVRHPERHPFLTKQARKVRGEGWSGGEAVEVLRAIDRYRCEPPLFEERPEEFAEIVQYMDKLSTDYAREYVRQDARESVREARAAEKAKDTAAQIQSPYRTLADELAEEDTEPYFAIEELAIADGNVLIPAVRKSGKTTLTHDLIRCLVDGEPLFGRYPVRQLDD